MVRLYGKIEDIDSYKIKEFFNTRAKKDVENLMEITSYHDKNNLEKRQEEINVISNKIDFKDKKILEIGCGLGRWSEFFQDKCEKYVGIDFSKELIEIAKEHFNYPNCYFQILSVNDLSENNLPISGPFDIIFITALLLYLNDDDIIEMFEKINHLIHENSIIYIRDTISILDNRLTLKDFYSNELEVNYNAIYRTEEELLELFKTINNFKIIDKNIIFNDLNDYDETSYEYFILKNGD